MKWLLTLALMSSTSAWGQDIKPLCPDRGAIQACIVDEGHVQVETSLVDWFNDSESTLLIGDTVVRLGLSEITEVQVGFSPWVRKSNRVGNSDLRLALRHNVKDDQLSLAVQPMIVVPVGSERVTQGDWGVGAALALTYDASAETQFYASPTVMMGPSTIVSGAIGINQTIHGPFGGTVELFGQQGAGQTQVLLDFTTVWTASEDVEVDLNANVGLTSDSPALELIVGISRRF